MADFCRQCSISVLGIPDQDYGNDLSELSTAEDTANGVYASVICEGCGFIFVDHTGKCVSSDCSEHHQPHDKYVKV